MNNLIAMGSVLLLLLAMLNPKTQLFCVLKEQISVYKNDKTQKYSFLDFITFFLIPIVISVLVAIDLPLNKIVEQAGTIITIFSLIATLPLSFLAVLMDKILKTKKEEEVAKETFTSITIDIVYSMIVIALVVFAALTNLPSEVEKVLVGFIVFFVVKIVLNILMIIKRVFRLM